MSAPISICLIARAAASETAYQRVLNAMKYNAECGHFSIWTCRHEPRCRLPEMNAAAALLKRLRTDLSRGDLGGVTVPVINAVSEAVAGHYADPHGLEIDGVSGMQQQHEPPCAQ